MKNSIKVKVCFSYQGQDHSPSAVIDLDQIMRENKHIPELYSYLAKQNNIDTYSYLYEVMESHELEFEDAVGLAIECMTGNSFDIPTFEKTWIEQKNISLLQNIARSVMGVENLDKTPELKQALLEAFEMGKNI